MKHDTAEFFNQYSDKFNAIYGEHNSPLQRLVNKYFRKSMLLRFMKTLKYSQPIAGKTVLDVGCGPGHYSIALAKMGAKEVYGIDFAEHMIGIARKQAQQEGVSDKCRFDTVDFFTLDCKEQYDILIFMGFMDYIEDPLSLIQKATQLARSKILFSFPANDGLLAWQRKIRYKKRCPLFLYKEKQIRNLFKQVEGWDVSIEKISRDYFVKIER